MCLIAISIAVGLATLAVFYPKREEVEEMTIDQLEQSLRIQKLQLEIKIAPVPPLPTIGLSSPK